jgi:hypothetical protein
VYGSTPLALCTVTGLGGAPTESFYDAAAAGWVSGRLWAYNSAAGAYALIGPDPWNDGDSLTPWAGYWFWSADMDLTLDIPQP